MSELDGSQIGFGDPLEAFPSWESLSANVKVGGWEWQRGRTDEFERTGAGSGRIFVKDRSNYLAGASFPTHGRIRLRGSDRFRGHVDEVDGEVHSSGLKTDVTLELTDLRAHLAGVELVIGEHGHPTPTGREQYVFFEDGQVDDRIILALTQAGVPSPLRSIFSGNVMLIESVYNAGASILQVIDEAVDAEWPGVANSFIDAGGRFCFRGRHARFNPGNPTYGINFWEAGASAIGGSDYVTGSRAQMRGLRWSKGKSTIYNRALAYPQGMAEDDLAAMLYEDATSVGLYGQRSWSAENLLTKRHLSNGNTGADEARLFARYQVDNHKAPAIRARKITFRTLRDSDPRAASVWALMQGVEISDVLDLYTPFIAGRYFVEGITQRAEELDGTIPNVTTELDLSPAAFWSSDPF